MYFSIHKSTNGQYYFLINSDNHEVVATSETYVYKESAKRTINAIKSGINPDTIVVDVSDY
ncbi:YegP family protein [Limosilactobacillus sp.]|jgi:uncharacterized protein YegP (UPF0339 family)|uniref:YegP family protein n=1 Tax=Limosilactobacillus sp. TaxID=2773925 RepID=UPI0025BF3FD9|nr:DUF1508 domain-containing protein [Limosilactobacillus sp.]MCH3922356.1 DUF1508 domain-containing protein [Limosilactobacillus sp.]MCH3929128.1 DUF1508 domain-containing protein [Limosilactobacillus sp.]